MNRGLRVAQKFLPCLSACALFRPAGTKSGVHFSPSNIIVLFNGHVHKTKSFDLKGDRRTSPSFAGGPCRFSTNRRSDCSAVTYPGYATNVGIIHCLRIHTISVTSHPTQSYYTFIKNSRVYKKIVIIPM